MRSDAELIAEAAMGCAVAFGLLVERYERAVLGVAIQIVRNGEAARDIAQESFLAAYRKLSTLKDHSQFGAWLLQIARNRALSTARKLRSDREVPLGDRSIAITPAQQLDQRLESLLDAIVLLPETERTVILMHYFDGFTAKEISEMTDRPVGTVTKRLSRAYERLRKLLTDPSDRDQQKETRCERP